jgi:hypothetical protein
MSNADLDKTSWELIEILKDTAKKNLAIAVSTKQIKIEEDILPKLFSLLDASMSEGYNKSYKHFSSKFEKISKDYSNNSLEADGTPASLKKRK